VEAERKRAPRRRRASASGTVVDFAAARGESIKEAVKEAARKTRVAVTGGAGLLGSRFVRALAQRGDVDVLVLDLAPAPDVPGHVRHRFVDLNLPYADGAVLKILREEQPDVLVHLAALRSPLRDSTYQHELNSLGALHVLAAAGEAGVPRIILGSTTLVYGARGDNPNHLTESHPLRPDPQDRFVRDFVEAEQFARDFVRRHPSARLAILRFVPLLAPELRDYRSKLFAAPFIFHPLGYDPLIQALHPEDAVDALVRAYDRPELQGVFNVAPDDVLPLSTVYLLYGTLPIPVPHPVAYVLNEALWLAGVGLMPGVHTHYFRYLCVADNAKARKALGWEPRYTSLETAIWTARARRGKGRAIDFDALEEAARRAQHSLRRKLKRTAAAATPEAPRKTRSEAKRAAS